MNNRRMVGMAGQNQPAAPGNTRLDWSGVSEISGRLPHEFSLAIGVRAVDPVSDLD